MFIATGTVISVVVRSITFHLDDKTTESALRRTLVIDEGMDFDSPENLEALTREGARLIEISPLRDAELTDVDALYIGGGFPVRYIKPIPSIEIIADVINEAIADFKTALQELKNRFWPGIEAKTVPESEARITIADDDWIKP